MKTTINCLISMALMAISTTGHGYDFNPVGETELPCYSRAMIGYDSVINSRLGVPAEHALELAVQNQIPASSSPSKTYSGPLLRTILDAYLWQESPHSYAVKVFYRCAQSQSPVHSAMVDWVVTDP